MLQSEQQRLDRAVCAVLLYQRTYRRRRAMKATAAAAALTLLARHGARRGLDRWALGFDIDRSIQVLVFVIGCRVGQLLNPRVLFGENLFVTQYASVVNRERERERERAGRAMGDGTNAAVVACSSAASRRSNNRRNRTLRISSRVSSSPKIREWQAMAFCST